MYPRRLALLAVLAALAAGIPCFGMTPEERESYRHMLLLNLPDVPQFDQWIREKNELPPDFDALPRNNALPDPLTFADGRPVKSAADWPARRSEILDLYQKYVWGKIPPHPKVDHADVTETPDAGQGFTTRTIVLHMGPGGAGALRLTLQIPAGEGAKGPFPVVMGPSLAGGLAGPGRGRGTAAIPGRGAAVSTATATAPAPATATAPAARGAAPAGGTAGIIRSHGYIVASIAASDGNDDSASIAALFPEADPGTLPRRGWAASAVVDYLLTLPEVDGKHIAITGFSRDGKMAAIGAALDPRIAAVIAGSPGIGGILSFRQAGEPNMAESIQSTTLMFPDWFHPRLRYFVGREDRLPVDGNLLLAAIAPRPFFMMAGLNDEVSNNWGDEQSFHSAQKAYDLLGAPDRLGILRVPGNHGAANWEQAMTWLDIQFGRSDKKWTNQWMFPWNYQDWKNTAGNAVDLASFPDRRGEDLLKTPGGKPIATAAEWETRAADVRKNLQWLLGDSTPVAVSADALARGPALQQNVPEWVIGRSVGAMAIPEFGWYAAPNSNTATRAVTFNGIKATLYYPKNAPAGAKLPAVVWLHSYSYPLGYMWVYHREVHPILALVQEGYAVLAYDQSGFGSRMNESASFYQQTPLWSQMGKLVQDAQSAVGALAGDSSVDPGKIFLFGYGLGGTVALQAAALDPRVKGVASLCGFTPMRTDTADKGTGGIARFAIERGLMPRLGAFIGSEGRIPVDYDELIAAIAPRPVYVLNPLFDRSATSRDVHDAVEAARRVYALYNAADRLKIDEPFDYNRLAEYEQDRVLLWMDANMK